MKFIGPLVFAFLSVAPWLHAASAPPPGPDQETKTTRLLNATAEQAALASEIARLSEALAKAPASVRMYSQRGDAHLFLGQFKESVADFEKMIALDASQDAPHWRLGIAYYFAGEFAKASAQFLKYQSYESGDRENGIWKFMADARLHGVEKARTMMIEYTRFDREPFPDLYEMFAGRMKTQAVLEALAEKGLARDGAPQFFAHYYAGVHESLLGHSTRALDLLNRAAASDWGLTAEGGPAYMWRVARLHRDQLDQEARAKPMTPAAPVRVAGLAAAFKADAGLADHPDVIFADDFETGGLGERWDEIRNEGAEVLSFADPENNDLGNRSLRVEAHLGKNTGGGLTKWFAPADQVFVRFYVKFDPDCDYVHHFVTLRANRGLTGADRWSGFGGAGLKPAGDERFSTALEPWGDWGKIEPPGTWNFYSYWHQMKPSPDGKFWGHSFRPEREPTAIPRGRWICAEFMLQHNSPGEPDGSQAYWIDGVEQGRWHGINWRTSADLRANALTLESYITDRWTKQKVNVLSFDNVVIARSYIGPVGP